MDGDVIPEDDGAHGAHLPLLTHVAVGLRVCHGYLTAIGMQEIKAVLGVIAKDAVVAGEVERGVWRPNAVPIAAVILVKTARRGMSVVNWILLITSIPFNQQVGGVNGCSGAAVGSLAIVKVPACSGVEGNANVIDQDTSADSADDAA